MLGTDKLCSVDKFKSPFVICRYDVLFQVIVVNLRRRRTWHDSKYFSLNNLSKSPKTRSPTGPILWRAIPTTMERNLNFLGALVTESVVITCVIAYCYRPLPICYAPLPETPLSCCRPQTHINPAVFQNKNSSRCSHKTIFAYSFCYPLPPHFGSRTAIDK